MEYNDIVGKQINDLKVVSFVEKVRYKKRFTYFYLCECICGKSVKVCRNDILSNHTKSCGCLKLKSGKENKSWTGFGEISGRFWNQIKRHATDRKLDFEITIVDAWNQFEKQKGICSLSGMPITLKSKKKNYASKTASLDRIDNDRGYFPDNIQWVHKNVNWMKGKFAVKDFIEICQKVSDYSRR